MSETTCARSSKACATSTSRRSAIAIWSPRTFFWLRMGWSKSAISAQPRFLTTEASTLPT